MTAPTSLPPQQGQDDGPQGLSGQQQSQRGGDDRPTLEELRQQSAALSEQITKHLGRGTK